MTKQKRHATSLVEGVVSALAALLMLIWCCIPSLAVAEDAWVDVGTLRAQAEGGWHETIQAHGRTITIDVAVEIPDVAAMPVLTARQMVRDPSIPLDGLALLDEDWMLSLMRGSNGTFGDWPAGGGRKWVRTAQGTAIDWTVRSEENPLDAGEVRDVLQREAAVFFGQDTADGLVPRELTWESRVYYPDNLTGELTDDAATAWGTYMLTMDPSLRGIPVLAEVLLPQTRDTHPLPPMQAFIYLMDAENYNVQFGLLEEVEAIADDVLLQPFAQVQAMLRAQIEAGTLRTVERLALAYAAYAAPDEAGLVWLVPTWVIRGECYESSGAENPFTDAMMVNSPGEDARPVYTFTADAQTLRPIDPLAEMMQTGGYMGQAPSRDAITRWEDVK